MQLIDSHCHLDKLKFDTVAGDKATKSNLRRGNRLSTENDPKTLAAALAAARSKGVAGFLCIGTDVDSFEGVKVIAESSNDIWCSAGIHPLAEESAGEIQELELLAMVNSSPKVIAVGECGLDYYYQQNRCHEQRVLFEKHLNVALAADKPIIIHTREAREDTMVLLEKYCPQGLRGVLHCFTESLEMAQRAVDLGFYISFSGIITFRNAQPLREVVRALPLDSILVETDSPYLAPMPHRGKSNFPQWVVEVAHTVASIKDCSIEDVAKVTTRNFQHLFKPYA